MTQLLKEDEIDLRSLRNLRGMTQRRLSNLSGVTIATISAIENGKRKNATVGTFKSLLDALGFELFFVLIGDNDEKVG